MRKWSNAALHRLLRRWLSGTLRAGTSSQSISDASRRTFIINLFCLVGVLFTAPLGIISLIKGHDLLGLSLFGIAALYFWNHLYLRRTQDHVRSGNVILYPLHALMLYLVYSGGVNGTGHVWIYCIPPVSLFLHGLKRGITEVILFTLALIVILFFMDTPFDQLNYHPDLNSRIVYSFVLIAFLSTIYEYISSRFNQSLKQLSIKLEEAATTDPLTGLLNRRGLEQNFLASQWLTPNVWLLDVDFFKRINDEFGHEQGDECLVALSKSMKVFFKGQAVHLSRWGGEEFLIVLNDSTKQVASANALREMLLATSVPVTKDHTQTISATVSIGVTVMKAGESISDALGRADKALYKAKENGRNQVAAE